VIQRNDLKKLILSVIKLVHIILSCNDRIINKYYAKLLLKDVFHPWS